jgi:predicted phosphodiesterase
MAGSGQARAIYAISDLHTDRCENLACLRANEFWPADARSACAVVAGDISHRLDVLEDTLGEIASRFGRVFFVPGNHELWSSTDAAGTDSLAKFTAVLALCARLGVETAPARVADVMVVPLFSWYDRSLAFPAHATGDAPPLSLRLWADYSRCRWPPELLTGGGIRGNEDASDAAIAAHFARLNEPIIASANAQIVEAAAKGEHVRGILSLSHFLPAACCLPDWCEPTQEAFDADWISHGAARKAALFANVAGCATIDAQLRTLAGGCAHVHVFGHSHRPKDFELRGVRYVHHPMGKGTEREWGALPSRPTFLRLWDEAGAAVPAERRIIRYWKEVGKVGPRDAK